VRTSDFDYHLPPERIAQKSVEPRDASRLLLLDRETGERRHAQFFEIIEELREGDVLVMNNSKVFNARLKGELKSGREIEVFLLRPEEGRWQAMVKPARKVTIGEIFTVGNAACVLEEKREDGVALLSFREGVDVMKLCEEFGEVPVPPYVEGLQEAKDGYQTVYAKEVGSVAAPTAGFHFTEELLESVRAKGVQIEEVTLHVGIGTFRPVKVDALEDHEMHAEFVEISKDVSERLAAAKEEGRRVIAVGTTTTRTLEGAAESVLKGEAFSGDVNVFITPGFQFQVIDALITNFHLPKSTLLVLVSAFAGRENVLAAYKEAVEKEYRFYSFGDAMFIR